MKNKILILFIIGSLFIISCSKTSNNNTFPCNNYNYYVQVKDSNFVLSIPSAFSPNGDGVNDLFSPLTTDTSYFVANSYRMTIKSKSNATLFETQYPSKRWDAGLNLDSGRYFYFIKFQLLSGKKVDTCGVFFALKNGNGNCLMAPSNYLMTNVVFEDQFNVSTGIPIYVSLEHLCP